MSWTGGSAIHRAVGGALPGAAGLCQALIGPTSSRSDSYWYSTENHSRPGNHQGSQSHLCPLGTANGTLGGLSKGRETTCRWQVTSALSLSARRGRKRSSKSQECHCWAHTRTHRHTHKHTQISHTQIHNHIYIDVHTHRHTIHLGVHTHTYTDIHTKAPHTQIHTHIHIDIHKGIPHTDTQYT